MAFGDTFKNKETVASGDYMILRPAGDVAWVIHNIYAPATSSIEFYSSTTDGDDLIMETTGSILSYNFHANNVGYYKVKNVSGVSINISYDGIVTQV